MQIGRITFGWQSAEDIQRRTLERLNKMKVVAIDDKYEQLSLTEVRTLYNELLYAVISKFPGESRHRTALRYIREREQRNESAKSADAVDPVDRIVAG